MGIFLGWSSHRKEVHHEHSRRHAPDVTSASLLERYRQYCLIIRSVSVRKVQCRLSRLRQLTAFLGDPAGGAEVLAGLEPKTLRAFLVEYAGCHGAGSRRDMHAALRSFLCFAHEKRLVPATAHLALSTRRTRLGTVREFSRRLHATSADSTILPRDVLPSHPRTVRFFRITPGQVVELMAAAPAVLRADSLRLQSIATVIGLLYCTGLRISEALELTLRDIAADGSVLHVVKGKLGKERLVPLSPSAYAALTGFLKVREPYTNKADSGPLFIDAGGTALTRKQVHASVKLGMVEAGIQPANWGLGHPRAASRRGPGLALG